MELGKKTFAVRDISRALIAFGILILAMNFNHYILIYILGTFTLIIGILNLFSLNPRIKIIGALNMVLAGIYFILSTLILYTTIFGLMGSMIMVILGAVLVVLSLRFIFYFIEENQIISF